MASLAGERMQLPAPPVTVFVTSKGKEKPKEQGKNKPGIPYGNTVHLFGR